MALLLLGFGIYYSLSAVTRNSSLDAELEENKSTLARLYQQDPFPATTNVDAAKRETEKVRTAVGRMRKFFAAPPVERVTGANAPMPYARNLEKLKTPTKDKIVAAVRRVCDTNGG